MKTRDDRHSRRLRGRPDDEGRGRADLSDRRLCTSTAPITGRRLFNLEAEGYRYTRIGNPTTAVLERRVAALEGGVGALCVASGQAAVHYATLNLTGLGTNIVSVPAALRHHAHAVRPSAAQSGRHRPLRRVGSSRARSSS